MFQPTSGECVRFNKVQAAISHLEILVGGSIRNMKELFVPFAFTRSSPLSFPAWHTPHAIGLEAEAQLFIPVLLFLGEEDERAAAVTALARNVVVMRHRHRGGNLAPQIGSNCRVWDATFFGRVPVKERVTAVYRVGIQPCNVGAPTVARMINEVGVLVSGEFHDRLR